MFWIIVAVIVVAVLAFGWWTSGRPSSALKGVDGADQSLTNGNAQFEHMRNQSNPGGPGLGGGSSF